MEIVTLQPFRFLNMGRHICDMAGFLIYKKYLTRNTAFAIIYHAD